MKRRSQTSTNDTKLSRARLTIRVVGLAIFFGGIATQGGVAASAVGPVRAQEADVAAGAVVYSENCATCHQATGLGVEGTFPPLIGNPSGVDADYVEDVVRNGLTGPIEVLGVNYDGEMASFADLSDDDIASVVAYVGSLASTDPADLGGIEPDVVEPGDVGQGRDLFIGANALDNGGAACSACHTAGDVGNLGGWSFGPELTESFEVFGGEAGLSGWLGSPASEVMQPIFDDQPLTPDEIADIVAFLGDAPSQPEPSDPGDGLAIAGVVGFFVLIGGMAIAWRGMRQTYAQRLRSNA